MTKRPKANPSTIGLNSPQVEGQGTTNRETGKKKMDSSRRKKKSF
ncbi:YuzL family protein [Bacillaceae bacterium S4-13-58]